MAPKKPVGRVSRKQQVRAAEELLLVSILLRMALFADFALVGGLSAALVFALLASINSGIAASSEEAARAEHESQTCDNQRFD
jgi:hypothetical protein